MSDVFLFDIDGVLIQAHGYLRALQDTVAYFSQQLGVGEHPPTEAEVRAFEANGLTSEWDSAPMCIAALLIERLRRDPNLPLPARWPDALDALHRQPMPLPHPDYAAMAVQVRARLDSQAEIAHVARSVLWAQAPTLAAPQHTALRALLDTLLGNTYTFAQAPIMRHFQHLTIGSQAVAQTYGVAPAFESPAYLQTYDIALLTLETHQKLRNALASGRIGASLYTARPSLPPAKVETSLLGYSPEAELAQAMVGLEDLPLIGFGRLVWLAQQHGEKAGRLVKPSPVQALAAIGAAYSGQEIAALEAAFALYSNGELRPPLANLGPTTVHVFEDTPTGLLAVQRAVMALQEAGLAIDWRAYGIASAEDAKAQAIAAQGMAVYPSINEALKHAFQH